MNNKLLAILLMVGNSFLAHANNPFNDYLLAAQTDVYDIELGNARIPEMNVMGSWFEDAQFRINSTTPTNNIDIKKNYLSYEVRVKPKAWGQKWKKTLSCSVKSSMKIVVSSCLVLPYKIDI
jgi:hypothetical protein